MKQTISREVQEILKATGHESPELAIRELAQGVLRHYLEAFPDAMPPHNMEALASFRSIRLTNERPVYSPDAELAPDGRGGVLMRVNADRPRTRQRFSIGHEIGHTLFSGYQSAVRCRKRLDRDWAKLKDPVESLCDVAASEFLFPEPYFHEDARAIAGSTVDLISLMQKYEASPDATLRRFVEVRDDPHAVIFFRWKLKPTEVRRLDARNQRYMFGSRETFQPERKLRVEYSIANTPFERLGHHIPSDKSLPDNSAILQASTEVECVDTTEQLNLGPLVGRFNLRAFPIYTSEADAGPSGARSIAAVISPAPAKPRKRKNWPR